MERPVRTDDRMVVARDTGQLAKREMTLCLHVEQGDEPTKQRGLDELTLAARLALNERRLAAQRSPHAGDDIGNGDPDARRAGFFLSRQAHEP